MTQLYSNKLAEKFSIKNDNYIINGNFDFWQRNTSQTSNGYGSDDRWANRYAGGLTYMTHSRQSFTIGQTDVPGNPKYFSRTDEGGAVSSSDYIIKEHRIENVSTLSGKTATLSFYAKANSSLNISTELAQYFGSGGSSTVVGIGVNKVAVSTSWQKFELTFDIPSISGKTVGSGGDDYLVVIIWFSGGSDYNSRNDSLGFQTGIFDISQVKLEEGDSATPFIPRPLEQELALCQRYYWKSYDLDTVPGSSTSIGYTAFQLDDVDAATRSFVVVVEFPVVMRTIPTITCYSYLNGASGYVVAGGVVNKTANISGVGQRSFRVYGVGNSVTYGLTAFQATADAEL